MDDRAARNEWGWRPRFDLVGMVNDMLDTLSARLG
jgi:nucleoside-diphosphate-sugar epimerase